MTEPERTGGKTRLVPISIVEAAEIEAAGIDAPKLYVNSRDKFPVRVDLYYCEPAEIERWREARRSHQAGGAQ